MGVKIATHSYLFSPPPPTFIWQNIHLCMCLTKITYIFEGLWLTVTHFAHQNIYITLLMWIIQLNLKIELKLDSFHPSYLLLHSVNCSPDRMKRIGPAQLWIRHLYLCLKLSVPHTLLLHYCRAKSAERRKKKNSSNQSKMWKYFSLTWKVDTQYTVMVFSLT